MSRPADQSVETHVSDSHPQLRVAFVVAAFPLLSETFILDQIAHLLDRDVDVEVFSFHRGDEANVSRKYFDYGMASRVQYFAWPPRGATRFLDGWRRARRLLARHPRVVARALNVLRYRELAYSLRLLYWVEPFAGRQFDVVHCHFGTVARDFVPVRDVARLDAPMVTTFYGYDVSKVFREQPRDFYDELKARCSVFFVMSEDMRRRVVAHGFPAELVHVHPVGIDVSLYPFRTRTLHEGDELKLVAVGRFVEKKGFSDLLRALALVKERASRPVSCVLVGGGVLEPELRELAQSLGLQDVVRFAGPLPLEEVVDLFGEMHALVAPSKTAADGDME